MLQQRKKNRLPEFSYDTPGAYFVTICTKDRMPILGTIVGAGDHTGPYTQLSEIGKTVEAFTKTVPGIDRYVIMPDHVHMILLVSAEDDMEGPMWSSAPTKRNIQTTIRSWKTLISKALGTSIWQRSYYEHVIRCEQDYWEIVKYIEENPAKWYYRRGG